ncbi:MAG: hypothetical protein PPFGHCPK_01207 [Spiroplasma endosymbiont of Drosophila atripex]|nr:MAG: hypothetical protein PPFGHCPK_01207 [Spiroplasma endosymbiont of Drosophila atripex]
MLKFIRKFYNKYLKKYFKKKNKELQKLRKEILDIEEEMKKLKEDNIFLFKTIKMFLNYQNSSIDNPLYFNQDDHIYEEIKEKTIFEKFIYENVKDETTSLSSVGNNVPPQLPPRNKTSENNMKVTTEEINEIKLSNITKKVEEQPIYEKINTDSIYDEVKSNIKPFCRSIS